MNQNRKIIISRVIVMIVTFIIFLSISVYLDILSQHPDTSKYIFGILSIIRVSLIVVYTLFILRISSNWVELDALHRTKTISDYVYTRILNELTVSNTNIPFGVWLNDNLDNKITFNATISGLCIRVFVRTEFIYVGMIELDNIPSNIKYIIRVQYTSDHALSVAIDDSCKNDIIYRKNN